MLVLSILLYALTVALTIGAIFKRDGVDLFNPLVLFLLYLFIQLGLSTLTSVLFNFSGEISLPLPQYEGRYIQVMFLGIITTLLVFLGSTAVGGRRLALRYTLRPLSGIKTYLGILILFPVGYFSFWLLLEVNGGLDEFLRNRESWRGIGMLGQGIYSYPATTLLNIVALFNLSRVYTRPSSTVAKVAAFGILLLSILPSVFLGFRALILFPLIQSLVIIHYGSQRISTSAVISAGALIGLLFTGYGVYREAAAAPGAKAEVGFDEAMQILSQKPELALNLVLRSRGADVVATVIDREAQSQEYDFGPDSLIELLTIWVPNSLWPDKPLPSHIRFTTYFFGEALAKARNSTQSLFGGYSPTFIGESYWHLGVIGVVCLALLWGAMGRIALNTLRAGQSQPQFLVVYSYFFIFMIFSAEYIQGAAQAVVLVAVGLIPLLMILSASDQGENPHSPAQPAQ